MFEDDDDRRYAVVRNDEEQYSVWPQSHPVPIGWKPVGIGGTKAECLAHINEVWVDMRPKRLRELRRRPPAPTRQPTSVAARPAGRTPWLISRTPRPAAALRLYCFPHSGGSAGEYVRLLEPLPDVEVWGVQLPGRGSHHERGAIDSMPELVEALVAGTEFEAPFAFIGHSLGALVAYEATKALRERGRPQPEHLFVSACTPPHHRSTRAPLHVLSDADLLDAIQGEYGGLPSAIRDEPELLALVLPYYRADFRVYETYRASSGDPPTRPVTVVGGGADTIPIELLAQWSRHTTGPFQLHRLPGGHFYWRDPAQGTELASIVSGGLGLRAG